MRRVPDPFGRIEDAEANQAKRIPYFHHLRNACLYDIAFGICRQLLQRVLYSDQRYGRRSRVSSRQTQTGESV